MLIFWGCHSFPGMSVDPFLISCFTSPNFSFCFSSFPLCLFPIAMSVNSSSSSNASLPPPSLYSVFHECCSSRAGAVHVTAMTITSILLLLPLYIYIIYLGFKRWRQQRSNMTTSHSDVFTYHVVVVELMSVSGFTLICCSVHTDLSQMMMMMGFYFFFINLFGQMFIHVLTCVERYLAVVHPVTYLSLKQERGVRIRDITICCAWLLCATLTSVLYIGDQVIFALIFFCSITVVLIVVSFCSLSVLCVLIRPGPGEGGGGRQQVNKSKLRAFYTIMAILGVLLLRFGVNMISTVTYVTPLLGDDGSCTLWLFGNWVCLPSSLVLPLLFLQRAGKLLCCKNKNKSGPGSD